MPSMGPSMSGAVMGTVGVTMMSTESKGLKTSSLIFLQPTDAFFHIPRWSAAAFEKNAENSFDN